MIVHKLLMIPERCGSVLKIGQEAVGKPGAKEALPEKLRAKESPNDRRKLS